MSNTALRPRSTSEILDAAIQLYRERFTPLVVISAVATLPAILVGVVNAAIILPQVMSPTSFNPFVVVLMYPLAIIAYLWRYVVEGASVLLTAEAYEGRDLEPAVAMRRAFALGGGILGAVILKYLIVFGWLLLGFLAAGTVGVGLAFALSGGSRPTSSPTILGAAFLAVLLGFGFVFRPLIRYFGTTPAVVLEGRSDLNALRRSKELAHGSFGKIFGTMISVYFLYFIVYFASLALLTVVLPSKWMAQTLAGLLVVVVGPVVPVTVTLLYYDLRIRKEGLDLDLMATQLGDHRPVDGTADVPIA